MKRPVGVTVSAVLLLLGSLVLTLFAVLAVVGGAIGTSQPHGAGAPAMPQPGFLMAVMIGEAALILAMAVWGFITFTGLLRMRPWARISMLVIGGGQALLAGPTSIIMFALVFVPFPLPPSPDAAHAEMAQAFVKYFFAGFALVAALHAALGVWWVVYFARKKMAAAFASAGVPDLSDAPSLDSAAISAAIPVAIPVTVGSRRPLLISVLAVLNLVGVVSCVALSAMPIPALFFGSILEGWQKVSL